MSEKGQFLASSSLLKDSFTFTLPKKVREKIGVKRRFRVLSFFLEVNDQISIGFQSGDKEVIGSSDFYASYQITIPKTVRDVLKIDKGDVVGFHEEGDTIFIRKM